MKGKIVPNGTIRDRFEKVDDKWIYHKVGYSHNGRPIKPNALRRNKPYVRELNRINSYKYRQVRREKLFEIYGNKCACCGESNPLFLSIDHINNDGNMHRKKLGCTSNVWRDMINHPDKTKYQTLCFNCNFGKRMNGGICPHKN